jgi:protein tyrosine phosphatase (PTP) superfamily phosphohydrolase (DUF442 family)
MPPADVAAPAPTRARRAWRRRLVALAVLVALGAVLAEGARVAFGGNFHIVIPNRVYRSAQPSVAAIERAVADHGVRTVINLRGTCNPMPWYLEESRATHALGICQEDVCFSAGRLPSVTEMRRLVEVLDRCDYPVLLHCRRGADRTGLAAAVALLLHGGAPFPEAARQLGVRYGHLALGRPGYLDEFLDLYSAWLAARGREHAPATFRSWVLGEYRPGPCSARIELLTQRPLTAPRGKPLALRVRAHNTGAAPWRFSPLLHAGVHCGFHVWDARDLVVARGKAGQFDAGVTPGRSIDLTLVVPAIRVPGRYRLRVDLVDEQHCWFFQAGSEPLEEEIVVP